MKLYLAAWHSAGPPDHARTNSNALVVVVPPVTRGSGKIRGSSRLALLDSEYPSNRRQARLGTTLGPDNQWNPRRTPEIA